MAVFSIKKPTFLVHQKAPLLKSQDTLLLEHFPFFTEFSQQSSPVTSLGRLGFFHNVTIKNLILNR